MKRNGDNFSRAVTIGTFDGLHRGHMTVLCTLRGIAREKNLKPAVITFRNHPLSIIAPQRAPKTLINPDEKYALIHQKDVEVIMEDFTEAMMGLTARQWMMHLRDDYGVKVIVIGYDNTFGSDGRSMTTADYINLGKDMGVEVIEAPVIKDCSSSAARKSVGEGDMRKATEILGRPFSLTGRVVEGDHIGRTIGFPTANLDLPYRDTQLLPPFGVYLSMAGLPDGRRIGAITNIGVRPSVTSFPELRVETHILDFNENLYGAELRIELLYMLRPERRFESLDLLKEAIEKDKERAYRLLS